MNININKILKKIKKNVDTFSIKYNTDTDCELYLEIFTDFTDFPDDTGFHDFFLKLEKITWAICELETETSAMRRSVAIHDQKMIISIFFEEII